MYLIFKDNNQQHYVMAYAFLKDDELIDISEVVDSLIGVADL